MLGSHTSTLLAGPRPARRPSPRPARQQSPRTGRPRLAGVLAALALGISLVVAPAAAPGAGPSASQSVPQARAQAPFDQLARLGPLATELGPLAAELRELDPAGELGPYVAEALNGVNGPIGDPGPPADVDVTVPCRPTPARPRPVILVQGTFDNGPATMPRLGEPLRRQGFCVIAPTLGAYAGNPARGGLDSIVAASGPQLAEVIDRVRAETGAEQVDLVGYSQGAAIAGYTTKRSEER